MENLLATADKSLQELGRGCGGWGEALGVEEAALRRKDRKTVLFFLSRQVPGLCSRHMSDSGVNCGTGPECRKMPSSFLGRGGYQLTNYEEEKMIKDKRYKKMERQKDLNSEKSIQVRSEKMKGKGFVRILLFF